MNDYPLEHTSELLVQPISKFIFLINLTRIFLNKARIRFAF